ncbi:MAG: PAS domain S-box protein [Desulfosalsimonadaceae bacterium]
MNIKNNHPEIPEGLSPGAMRQALHELQVYQSELLMQNEELRRTQTALEAATERYLSFYDLAPVGFCTLNNKGLILEANLTFAAWIGEARGGLVNTPLTGFILPEDQDIYYLHRRQLFESGEPQACELRLLCRDKITLWVNIEATAARDPDGAPVCRIVLSDITGRKRVEKTLAEKEEMYRLIYNSVPTAIYHYDHNGTIRACNPKALTLFGLTEEQVIGLNLFEAETDERVLHCVKTALSGIPSGFAGKYTTISGKKIHFDSYNVPIFSDDHTVTGAIVVIEDIAERVQAEQALQESEEKARALLDATNEAVALFNREGILLDLNEAYARLMDIKKDEIIGKCIWEYFPPEVSEYRKAVLEQVFLTGQPVALTEERDNRVYGTHVYPIPNAAGLTTRIAIFARDITDRKRAEDELKASHAQLRELSKHLQTAREQERIRIARGIHDELGQVLTAIILETSRLAKKLPKGLKSLKANAETSADLAAGAIQSVRKIIAELRPALLSDLGLAEAIKWQAGEYGKRTGIGCAVCIDLKDIQLNDEISTAVFRIFQEAFTNVIRHAKATEMSVTLKAVDGDIELIVADNGIGIAGYPVYDKDAFGIMGMKERAQGLGGKLDISDVPGKGAVVVARIPIHGNPPA